MLQSDFTLSVANAPASRGHLVANGNKWGWQDGSVFTPQLVMLQPDLIRFSNGEEVLEDWIDEFLVGHGFNGFHVPVYARWFDIEATDGRTNNVATERRWTPDPRTRHVLEFIIRLTYDSGGMTHLWMWGDASRNQTPDSIPGGKFGPADLDLIDSIGWHLGSLPGWSIGYGYDLDEWATADDVRDWGDKLHAWGVELVGGRPAGPNNPDGNHAQYDDWNVVQRYSSYEHHRPTYSTYRNAIERFQQPCFSEDRFRVGQRSWNGKPYAKDPNYDETRRWMINGWMAGGVAAIWGDLSHGQGQWSQPYPEQYKEQYRRCNNFLTQRFTAELWPSTANHWKLLHDEQGIAKIGYAEDTATMPTGAAVDGVAMDCITGDNVSLSQASSFPYQSDWLVDIQ